MATSQFEHPKIDGDAPDLYEEFERFRSHVTFVFDGPLSELEAKQRAGWLGTWIGEQGREIYKTLNWADGEKGDPVKVLDKFAGYIRPRKKKRIARHRFKQRKQGSTESFDNFVKDLRLILMDCEYADPDDMLIDAIIEGVREKRVQERLLDRGEDLTLAKALEISQQFEMSQRQMKIVREDDSQVSVVSAKTKYSTSNNYGHNRGQKKIHITDKHQSVKQETAQAVVKTRAPSGIKGRVQLKVQHVPIATNQITGWLCVASVR